MWNRRGNSRQFRGGNRGGRGYNRQPSHSGFNRNEFGRDAWQPNRNIASKFQSGPGKRLAESELGITEYVMKDVAGFDGIIKARFSDFQVNEVDVKGNVAKLTDLSVPSPVKNKIPIGDQHELLDKLNIELIPVSVWNDIHKISTTDDSPVVKIDVTDVDKQKRTKIYEAVADVYGKRISGRTETVGQKKFIIFSRFATKRDFRTKWEYPEEFVHFIVYKENLDTMEAAQAIAEGLRMNHIKPSFFGYSGTKDRRAKTSQWFSLRKVDPVRISNCAKRLKNISVGNFEFKNYHLTLGYLKGNVFRIALRNITEDRESVDNAVHSFKEHGFINYYGLQRFGSRANVPTYQIGKHLLKREFQTAIDLILKPQGPFYSQLKCYKETKDPFRALSMFPTYTNSLERILLTALSKHAKNDFVTVLEAIPRNMRLLYIHSYQSWVWNRCVSERMRLFGMKLVVGDLVTENEDFDYDVSEDYSLTRWQEGNDEDKKEDHRGSDNEDEYSEEQDEKKSGNVETVTVGRKGISKYPKINRNSSEIREITQEDISEGKFSIYHLVLPLPGYDVKYPSNMKNFYEEITTNEGVNLNEKQKIKAYNLSGTYRKVLIKPHNLTWKHVLYDDPQCDLIRSDWEELRNINQIGDSDSGKYRALLLEITLGSSTYATMALRELLKRDTSSESQALKNDYHTIKDTKIEPSSGDDSEYAHLSQAAGCGLKRELVEPEEETGNKKIKEEE